MKVEQTHVFSAEKADNLDSKVRRWLQNPYKILAPCIKKGMTVIDYGCGNGYFSIPLSKMVGDAGKVYSVDIQKEMLEKLEIKLSTQSISNIFLVHKEKEKLTFPNLVDFAVAIYVVHEIPNQKEFYQEIFDLLKPGGKLLVIEPNLIVSSRKFKKSIDLANQIGFVDRNQLKILFSKSRILTKEK